MFALFDFDCITDGKAVPLAFVEKLIMSKDSMNGDALKEAAHGMSISVFCIINGSRSM